MKETKEMSAEDCIKKLAGLKKRFENLGIDVDGAIRELTSGE